MPTTSRTSSCAIARARTTERVSVTGAGGEANGRSETQVMTSDGRFVAFFSDATNLVPGDTNDVPDVFRRAVGVP